MEEKNLTEEKKTRKKRVSKKKAKKEEPVGLRLEITLLRKAPHKKEFILCDGKKLNTIKDLAMVLDEISDDVFWHHVNDSRNDFASWLDDVFEEKELAQTLRTIRDRLGTQITLLKHIVRRIHE